MKDDGFIYVWQSIKDTQKGTNKQDVRKEPTGLSPHLDMYDEKKADVSSEVSDYSNSLQGNVIYIGVGGDKGGGGNDGFRVKTGDPEVFMEHTNSRQLEGLLADC